jgi:hypothetical protein
MTVLSLLKSPALWLSVPVTKLQALYLYSLVEKAKDYKFEFEEGRQQSGHHHRHRLDNP